MKRVYEADSQKKADLVKLLEADPYGTAEEKKSFSRLGYKLKDLAKRCEPKAEEKIIALIEDEESGAEQGMGSIFG